MHKNITIYNTYIYHGMRCESIHAYIICSMRIHTYVMTYNIRVHIHYEIRCENTCVYYDVWCENICIYYDV